MTGLRSAGSKSSELEVVAFALPFQRELGGLDEDIMICSCMANYLNMISRERETSVSRYAEEVIWPKRTCMPGALASLS